MSELLVFGTGNAAVTRCYNTCFALHTPEGYFMVDAGGGNGILRILEQMNVPLTEIHDLFVTHNHTDHVLGVIWLIRMIGQRMLQGKYQGDLRIYGHDEVIQALPVFCQLTLQKKFCDLLGTRIQLIRVEDGESREILRRRVTFFDIHSTKMKQFGFAMELPEGRLTCLGDEPYQPLCQPYVEGAHYLLCEAFCLYADREQFKPYEKHHSTVKEASELAEQRGVQHLILWHTEDQHIEERKRLYEAEARRYCRCEVRVPDDQEVIEIEG